MQAQPGLKVMLKTPEEEEDEEEHYVDEPEKMETKKKVDAYDGRKRDPRFSNAEKSCLWELVNSLSRQMKH